LQKKREIRQARDLKEDATPKHAIKNNNHLLAINQRSDDCTSIAAFNYTLSHDYNALFSFACNATLCGENVAFLRLVQRWKAAWHGLIESSTDALDDTNMAWRQLFHVAVQMYHDFIDPTTAHVVGLNLEFRLTDALKDIFEPAAKTISSVVPGPENDMIAPFDIVSNEMIAVYHTTLCMMWEYVMDYAPASLPSSTMDNDGWNKAASDHLGIIQQVRPADSAISMQRYSPPPHKDAQEYRCCNNGDNDEADVSESRYNETLMPAPCYPTPILHMKTYVSTTIEIPQNFSVDVFNDVGNSVYLMVLRDTFPKYVQWRTLQDEQGPIIIMIDAQNKHRTFLSRLKRVFSRIDRLHRPRILCR
jgi:hypothetical protein